MARYGYVGGEQDDDEVWIGPRCGVQTPEQRFGPNCRRPIYRMLGQWATTHVPPVQLATPQLDATFGGVQADELDEEEDS